MIKTYNEHAAAFKYTAKVKLKSIIIIHHKRINQSSSKVYVSCLALFGAESRHFWLSLLIHFYHCITFLLNVVASGLSLHPVPIWSFSEFCRVKIY